MIIIIIYVALYNISGLLGNQLFAKCARCQKFCYAIIENRSMTSSDKWWEN